MRPLILALLCALAFAACKQQLTCGKGTHQDGDQCVADGQPMDAGPGADAAPAGPDATSFADVGHSSDIGAADVGSSLDVGAPDIGSPDAAVLQGDTGFALRCFSGLPCPSGQICHQDRCMPAPDPCHRDLDCPDNLVCDWGKCVTQCDGNDQCPPVSVCVERRCVAPPATCSGDKDCPTVGDSNQCNKGACESKCSHPCACRKGFECVSGFCQPAPAGNVCSSDEVCSCRYFYPGSDENHHCFAGQCGRTCSVTCDCGGGSTCQSGHCLPAPAICTGDDDCPCFDGKHLTCMMGTCLKACQSNCDCPAPQLSSSVPPSCVDGFCQVAPYQCSSDQDCACTDGHAATCDLTVGACSYGSCKSSCDCATGMTCQSGRCEPSAYTGSCNSETDCLCGQPCVDQGMFKTCGCARNYDCRANATVCDLMTGVCKAPPAGCQSNLDCAWSGSEENFCIGGKCIGCYPINAACYGDDKNCGTCDDGTPMICHHRLSDPSDDMNAMCEPACHSNLDCLVVGFGEGVCIVDRCTALAPDPSVPCKTTDDCTAIARTPLGKIYRPVCQNGECLPASCKSSCDCPYDYPSPHVCQGGLCVAAPAKCTTVDDCPCANMGQVACNAGGVCGPNVY